MCGLWVDSNETRFPLISRAYFNIVTEKKSQFEFVNMYYLHWILLGENIYVQNCSTPDWCCKLGSKVNKFFVIVVISFVLLIKGNSNFLSHFISSPMHMMSLLGQYLYLLVLLLYGWNPLTSILSTCLIRVCLGKFLGQHMDGMIPSDLHHILMSYM